MATAQAPTAVPERAHKAAKRYIYAWGAVAYFLLTGKMLFEGESDLDLANQSLHRPAPRGCRVEC